VAKSRKQSMSRRELGRHERFEQVSPDVGELDEGALDEALRDDPDATMAMIADLTAATDPALRELARRLAGRIFLGAARRGPQRPRGIGRLVEQPYRVDGGDLDLDASLDALVDAGGDPSRVSTDRLRVRGWVKPGTAYALLVDRSGSMGGKPLATAAVAASAVAWRAPADHSVLAFGKDVVVVKSQDATKAAELVVDDLLALRGFGTTDLPGALKAAAEQLRRSRAGRKVAVVLSDCRTTVDDDPVRAALGLRELIDELVIVAPAGDADDATEFAHRVGARVATVAGPAEVADVLADLLA
jgi:Mg-chelatase subunit ChlD